MALQPLPLLAAEAPPAAAASSGGGSVSSELFLKLQQMEQEILELRGRIEEQSHDIEQLKTRQKEHYLDFDRRINELKS
ncbi:MAG TPA: YbgF trimerization domain-containing protein, partial [Pseudomonadales bacterium]|nr:YbgF trimerization domain-containing protein [Pseudomonadales bacterium]